MLAWGETQRERNALAAEFARRTAMKMRVFEPDAIAPPDEIMRAE
jgi:hypothetical protein